MSVCLTILFQELISITVVPLAWPNIKKEPQREASVVDALMDGGEDAEKDGVMACSLGVGGLCSTWSK